MISKNWYLTRALPGFSWVGFSRLLVVKNNVSVSVNVTVFSLYTPECFKYSVYEFKVRAKVIVPVDDEIDE